MKPFDVELFQSPPEGESDSTTPPPVDASPDAEPGKLVQAYDGTGYFLDQKPVHEGTRLELRMPGDVWARCRFEPQGSTPALVLFLGHRWEKRFEHRRGGEVMALAGGSLDPARWYIWDRKEHEAARSSLWAGLDQDSWKYDRDARVIADAMNRRYAAFGQVSVALHPDMELRWPECRPGGAR